jgi:glycosyltransferase involved in cell wall biosynthesis
MDEIRVCHTNNDNKNAGGAYIITRRLEENIRQYGYIFDYITMDEFIETKNPEMGLLSNSVAYSARLRENRWMGHLKLPFFTYSVLKKGNYRIVHIDIDLAGKALLYAIPARLSGAKVIIHSHSTGIDGDYKTLKAIFHYIGRQVLPIFSNQYLACSKNAAKWMFPRRIENKATILTNGIDFYKFCYNEETRNKWRQKLGLEKNIIIGNIGVFSKIKNQVFLIPLLAELKKRGIDAKLLLVGACSDSWKQTIYNIASKNNVLNNVILYGFSTDTCQLLNAMDVYICPSLIEGFSLTLCEAQATGLPCIMSNAVPDEAIVSNWIERLDLREDLSTWCNLILKMAACFSSADRDKRKVDEKYSIEYMAKKLSNLYSKLI